MFRIPWLPSSLTEALQGFGLLGRVLGHFTFSFSGFKRIIFRNIFQRVLRVIFEVRAFSCTSVHM